jgi:hypothetical protein
MRAICLSGSASRLSWRIRCLIMGARIAWITGLGPIAYAGIASLAVVFGVRRNRPQGKGNGCQQAAHQPVHRRVHVSLH